MLINYFIWKADNKPAQAASTPAKGNDPQQYVKVDNKTATGGWW